MLATLAVTALVIAVGLLAPDLEYVERRWLPLVVLGVVLLVAAEIVNPPPAAGDQSPDDRGVDRGRGCAAMLVGAVLSFGRVSLAVSVEGRDERERVAVVDHRQDTTEGAADRRRLRRAGGAGEGLMAEVREIAFELERFAFTEPDRLEVVGRWTGLAGRRLGRPVLTLDAGGRRRRLTAQPGGHLGPPEGAEWRAVFAFDGDPDGDHERRAGGRPPARRRPARAAPPPRRQERSSGRGRAAPARGGRADPGRARRRDRGPARRGRDGTGRP